MGKYQSLIFLPNVVKYDRPTYDNKEEQGPLIQVQPLQFLLVQCWALAELQISVPTTKETCMKFQGNLITRCGIVTCFAKPIFSSNHSKFSHIQ